MHAHTCACTRLHIQMPAHIWTCTHIQSTIRWGSSCMAGCLSSWHVWGKRIKGKSHFCLTPAGFLSDLQNNNPHHCSLRFPSSLRLGFTTPQTSHTTLLPAAQYTKPSSSGSLYWLFPALSQPGTRLPSSLKLLLKYYIARIIISGLCNTEHLPHSLFHYSSGSQPNVCNHLIQFLMLRWPPTHHKLFLLLLYNCDFATVMNCNVSI